MTILALNTVLWGIYITKKSAASESLSKILVDTKRINFVSKNARFISKINQLISLCGNTVKRRYESMDLVCVLDTDCNHGCSYGAAEKPHADYLLFALQTLKNRLQLLVLKFRAKNLTFFLYNFV